MTIAPVGGNRRLTQAAIVKSDKFQRINGDLLNRTGVDFSRYRDRELTDAIANAVTFPVYLARSLLRPVMLLLALLLVAIVFVESGYFKAFLVFPGAVLVVANGILLGLMAFIRRMRADMSRIFLLSADLSRQVTKDVVHARAKLAEESANLPSPAEIFRGVNGIVVRPIVVGTVDRKIPLVGGVAAGITERFFGLLDARLASLIEKRSAKWQQAAAAATPADLSDWLQATERTIDSVKGIVSQVVNKAGKVIAFPFLTLFVIVFLVSAVILYGGYALMA